MEGSRVSVAPLVDDILVTKGAHVHVIPVCKGEFETHMLKNREKRVVEGNSGWSSPNRNYFFTERFAKSLLGMKKDDKIDMPEGSETVAVNGLDANPKQGIPKIYNEAKKYLSEMLSTGEEKEVSESKRLPKLWQRFFLYQSTALLQGPVLEITVTTIL